MNLTERKFDFFMEHVFMPTIDVMNRENNVLSWTDTLAQCRSTYLRDKKGMNRLAYEAGLTEKNERNQLHFIIKLCNAKAAIRSRIRLALAEDGYKVAKVKFEGVKVTRDASEINSSNLMVLHTLDRRRESEQSISELLAERNPDVMPLNVLASTADEN